MDADRNPWASALALIEKYGDEAAIFVAERLGALSLAGDEAGLARWKDISRHVDKLLQGETHRH